MELKFFSRRATKIRRPKSEGFEGSLFLQFIRVEEHFSIVTTFAPSSRLFGGSKQEHCCLKTYCGLRMAVSKRGRDYSISPGCMRGKYSPFLYQTIHYGREANVTS